MKGLEKLTSIRLAEVLSQKGVVPTEKITDALYTQDKHGEPFVEVLVTAGHITEWDLAKMVVENFQLPFVMASSYDIQKEVKEKLHEDLIFQHQIVPLDLYGNLLTIAMPILTPYDTIEKIQRKHDVEIFPYVGLITENKKVIGEQWAAYKEWQKKQEEVRERAREKKAAAAAQGGGAAGGGGWANIFDSADAAVRQAKQKK